MGPLKSVKEIWGFASQLVFDLEQLRHILHDGYQGRGDVRYARMRLEECILPSAERFKLQTTVLFLIDQVGMTWDTPLQIVADALEERGDASAAQFIRKVADGGLSVV